MELKKYRDLNDGTILFIIKEEKNIIKLIFSKDENNNNDILKIYLEGLKQISEDDLTKYILLAISKYNKEEQLIRRSNTTNLSIIFEGESTNIISIATIQKYEKLLKSSQTLNLPYENIYTFTKTNEEISSVKNNPTEEILYSINQKRGVEVEEYFKFEEESSEFKHWKIKHALYETQRRDYLELDTYFMGMAKLAGMRSKDPNTQVGACIVSKTNRILSTGYNGTPNGIDDDVFPWDRIGKDIETKYMFVCHAEANAIENYAGTKEQLRGSTIYVDLFPCNECAKKIIQAGIKEVVYLSDKYANTDSTIIAKELFDLAGVTYRQLAQEKQTTITLSLKNTDK